MKTKAIRFSIFALSMFCCLVLYAQPPGGDRGGRPPGGGMEDMLTREKQNLYKKVENLTADQIALLDGIYEEFEVTLKETFEEARRSQDREARREKMQALHQEKDELIADVLNEKQYAIYTELTEGRRNRGPRPDENREEHDEN